jgi:hypothetical protein
LEYDYSSEIKKWLKESVNMEWITEHYKWVFSGLGVPLIMGIISFIGWLFFKKQKSGDIVKQRQSARDDANQSQIGKIVNHKNSSRK